MFHVEHTGKGRMKRILAEISVAEDQETDEAERSAKMVRMIKY
jgi:hypothetical protein